MADNVRLSAGTADGATIAADDDGVALHQWVKLKYGADNSFTAVDPTNGLPVAVTDNATRDNGKIDIASLDQLPTADYDTGAGTQTVPMIGIALPASGGSVAGGSSTNPIRVDPTGTTTQPVSISSAVTVSQGVATSLQCTADTELPSPIALTNGMSVPTSPLVGAVGVSYNGSTLDLVKSAANALNSTGTGILTAQIIGQFDDTSPTTITENQFGNLRMSSNRNLYGTIRDAAGNERGANVTSSNALVVDGSAVTQPVSIAGNQAVNVAQLAGTTTDTNSGNKSAGTLRVVIATDQPQLTNALKVDGSGVTQPVSGTVTVNPAPTTSGGLSIYHVVAAASANAANVKASAGQVYGWTIFNNAAYNVYIKLHNTAGTPTAGAGVVHTIGVPAGGGSNIALTHGIAFVTGIGISIVKDITDAGSTAVAASDCVVDLHYK